MMHSTMRAAAIAALLTLTAAACAKGGRKDYANDGDTGAAAPATVLTPDAPQGPDSTAGVSQRSGVRGVSGDTLSGRRTTPAAGAQSQKKP